MYQDQIPSEVSGQPSVSRSHRWGFSLFWLTIVLLVGFITFIYMHLVQTGVGVLISSALFMIECCAYIAFGVVSIDTLGLWVKESKKIYHIAFILGVVTSLVIWLISRFDPFVPVKLRVLPFLWLASFLGCFIGSNLKEGWWENNFPPSYQVEAEVLAWHQPNMREILPVPLAKRSFDVLVAALGILFSAPLWLVISFVIWWEDPGPVLFVKNSVGKGGRNFKQYKFRTMIRQAENETGPVLAIENDHRVLWFGRILRKTALDELPQLINIIRGDMSFVGPRPQRTVLVHGYLKELPMYARRHSVQPGLAGLAQVADHYFISPEEKLAWDLLYIQRFGLLFDIKLMWIAFVLVFWLRWRKHEQVELIPRLWLGLEKPILEEITSESGMENYRDACD